MHRLSPKVLPLLLLLLTSLPAGAEAASPGATANLTAGGRIQGELRRREDGTPISGGWVAAIEPSRARAALVQAVDGHYELTGLAAGAYWVVVYDHADRVGMIYNDLTCQSSVFEVHALQCSTDAAQTVEVPADGTVSGIDFRLRRGASFEGTVVDAATGQAPEATRIRVYRRIFELPIREVNWTRQDGPNFRVEGLASGGYYLHVTSPGYTAQWYQLYNCPFEPFCFGLARRLNVNLGEVVAGLDFALLTTGSVSGQVLDEATGQAIENAHIKVSVLGSPGVVQAEGYTDAAGNFRVEGVPAVDVQVTAYANGYRSEYFDDIPVTGGSITQAQARRVRPGENTAGFDFRLLRFGGLTARVRAAESGAPLACDLVAIPVDWVGPSFAATCDAEGVVTFASLAPGRYYLRSHYVTGRVPYVVGKGSCNPRARLGYQCDLTGATAIEVRSGEISGPFELLMQVGGALKGHLDFAPVEEPPSQVVANARIFEEGGEQVAEVGAHVLFPLDFTAAGLAPGRYRLVFDGNQSWESLAWPDTPCNRWYCDPQKSEVFELDEGGILEGFDHTFQPIGPYQGCTASATALCLNQGRYRVEATWRDFAGASGPGLAMPLTGESGYFYFFSPENVEVVVKALNACVSHLGHHFWIYGAGLTNVDVELKVTDTLSGEVKLYRNGLGQTFQPILDSSAFATCDVEGASSSSASFNAALPALSEPPEPPAELAASEAAPLDFCRQSRDSLQLCLGGRFLVSARWTTADGASNLGFSRGITDDTGTFTFFNHENVEVVVKMLKACDTALPGYWFFASGLTDVKVDLEVRDLANPDSVKTYSSPLGPFRPVLDLGAFACP